MSEISRIIFRLPAYSRNIRKRLVKMPKLHFYDTGLACWLLGIRNADQLRNYPLRGALFETWVVSEILKHRIHQGEPGGVFYYRDRQGVEADLIISHDRMLSVIEIKAGTTVSDDMLGSVRKICAAMLPVGVAKPCLVYGGDSAQNRSDIDVLPWSEIHQRAWHQ